MLNSWSQLLKKLAWKQSLHLTKLIFCASKLIVVATFSSRTDQLKFCPGKQHDDECNLFTLTQRLFHVLTYMYIFLPNLCNPFSANHCSAFSYSHSFSCALYSDDSSWQTTDEKLRKHWHFNQSKTFFLESFFSKKFLFEKRLLFQRKNFFGKKNVFCRKNVVWKKIFLFGKKTCFCEKNFFSCKKKKNFFSFLKKKLFFENFWKFFWKKNKTFFWKFFFENLKKKSFYLWRLKVSAHQSPGA